MQKNLIKNLAARSIILASSLAILTNTALAADDESIKNYLITPKPKYLPGPLSVTQGQAGGVTEWLVETILPRWTTGMVGFIAMLSLLMLIISGIRYLTAYGNDEAAGNAKKMIIYSLAGLLISVFAYTIVAIIANIKISP